MPSTRDSFKSAVCICVFIVGIVSWIGAAAYGLSSLQWVRTYARQTDSGSPIVTVKGIYRCWQSNRGARGQNCGTAALVFAKGNRYEMGEEKGIYIVKGSRFTLSESKRKGIILDGGDAVSLEGTAPGEVPTTYLRQLWESVNGK